MSAVWELENYCATRERQLDSGGLYEPDPGVDERLVAALEAVDVDVATVREVSEVFVAADIEIASGLAGRHAAELADEAHRRLETVRSGNLAAVVRELSSTVGPFVMVEAIKPLLYPEQAQKLRM